MSSPDPPPPVYFLSPQAACESAIQRWPSARGVGASVVVTYGVTCQLPSAAVIIPSSSVRSFCKHPWRACTACAGKTAGLWNALRLSSPGSAAASVLHGGTVLPNRERMDSGNSLEASAPPLQHVCPVQEPIVPLCVSADVLCSRPLSQLPLLRRGWKSMTRSLVIRIWPSMSG